MKKCPICGEEIQDEAIKCKHCRQWLQKAIPIEEHEPVKDTNKSENGKKLCANYDNIISQKNLSHIMVILLIVGFFLQIATSDFYLTKAYGYQHTLLYSFGYSIPFLLFSLLFIFPLKLFITRTTDFFDLKNVTIALYILLILRIIAGS